MRAFALTVIVLVASSCASKAPPSVRYDGRAIAEPTSGLVRTFGAEPDAPCGHVDVGSVEVTCPGGCTFDEAIAMAKDRVAQAGVNDIGKVRTTTTRNGRVLSLHAVAVEVLPCLERRSGPLFPPGTVLKRHAPMPAGLPQQK